MTALILRIPNPDHEAKVLAERHRQGVVRRDVQLFPWEREREGRPVTDATLLRIVRQAIEAVGMDESISHDEHQAWMRVLSAASDASLLRLRRKLR